MHKIIDENGDGRLHDGQLKSLRDGTNGTIRIASPYITDVTVLSNSAGREFRILTSLSVLDVITGATSMESLKSIVEAGAHCAYCLQDPKFHAKVYIFGEELAIVTSANLTRNGLNKNIEVGVQLAGEPVGELTAWFDTLWKKATPLTLSKLTELQQKFDGVRRDFKDFMKQYGNISTFPKQISHSNEKSMGLRELLYDSSQFFLCNTDRRHDRRAGAGAYPLEEEMHKRRYAAAWETYNYPAHMQRVETGNTIFMYAKGVGIIGIGRATAKAEVLEPGNIDRIRQKGDTREWWVPVEWLSWCDDDKDACLLENKQGLSGTFLDVTRRLELRDAVRRHFLRE